MRGAIDIGSNSLRLLKVDDKHNLIEQKVAETRLGEGFREGSISSAAIARTLKVLDLWNKELQTENIQDLVVFATSAVRDARNRKEFAQLVENHICCPLRILSGEEEALYSFNGAVNGFSFNNKECLLIDIGGGSTEIALYEKGSVQGISMPFGAVRWKVMAYRRNEVRRVMERKISHLELANVKHFIGVGGTITTAAAILNNISIYKRELIHGKTISKKALDKLQSHLGNMTLAERKEVVGLPEPRADIIIYGLEILEILFDLLNIEEITVSDWGILDGILDEQA
ncbi:MAG: hypothetical protein RR219_00855 [Clostridiales bacterium]